MLILSSVWGQWAYCCDSAFPRPCFLGYPTATALPVSGTLHAVTRSRIVIGSFDRSFSNSLRRIKDLFHEAGFTPETNDRIDETARVFMAANIGFWSGVTIAENIGAFFRDRMLLDLARGASEEAWNLCEALGLNVSRYYETFELVRFELPTRFYLLTSYQFSSYHRLLIARRRALWQETLAFQKDMLTSATSLALNVPNLHALHQRPLEKQVPPFANDSIV